MPGDLGEVAEHLDADRGRHDRVVRGAGGEPARRRSCAKSGAGFQTARPTGQLRQVGRVDVLDDVRDEAEPVAHVAHRDDERGAGVGGEDQAHRVLLAADAERVHLEAAASRS